MTIFDFPLGRIIKVCMRHGLTTEQMKKLLGYCDGRRRCMKWTGPINDKHKNDDTRKSYWAPHFRPNRGPEFPTIVNIPIIIWELRTGKVWPDEDIVRHINRDKCLYGTLCISCCIPDSHSQNDIDKSWDETNPNQSINPATAICILFHLHMDTHDSIKDLARTYADEGASYAIVRHINAKHNWTHLLDDYGRILKEHLKYLTAAQRREYLAEFYNE